MTVIIEIKDFGFAYPSYVENKKKIWILKNLNLNVEKGEFLSIMGPTGSGKTTLSLALNGIVPQSSGGFVKGNIFIKGVNTKKEKVSTLAQTVGVVFQNPESQLFNMSVAAEIAFGLENIALTKSMMMQRIDWSLSLVDMINYKDCSPFELSGGQKQRVALAAILAMKPEILVLDEPTASLDPLGKSEVFKCIDGLRQTGTTIILFSHNAEKIAEYSDRVAVLDRGKIQMIGSPKSFFSRSTELKKIGVGIPQVTELSLEINSIANTNSQFINEDEAFTSLKFPKKLFSNATK